MWGGGGGGGGRQASLSVLVHLQFQITSSETTGLTVTTCHIKSLDYLGMTLTFIFPARSNFFLVLYMQKILEHRAVDKKR